MKIRRGFVSNSSSSSFVCDVCGENVSGMDMGLSDAEMFECNDGHTVCDSHFVGEKLEFHDLDLEQKRAYCLDRVSWESTVNTIKSATHEDELDDLYSDEIECEDRYNTSTANCPCCTLDKPTSGQIIQFLLSEAKTSREDVVKQIRERFKNYKEMHEKLGL